MCIRDRPVTVYYVSDEVGQAQYVSMFRAAGLNAIVCDSFVDPHYISYIEYKAVSYTHLDVYKRQVLRAGRA